MSRDGQLAEAVKRDYRSADLDQKTLALMHWCEKLTLRPAEMAEADVVALRDVGWTDREISDAAQVCSYFNYINRVADALGVDLEPDMPPDPRRS